MCVCAIQVLLHNFLWFELIVVIVVLRYTVSRLSVVCNHLNSVQRSELCFYDRL